MKKLICSLLTLTLVLTVFAGCRISKDPEPTGADSSPSPSAQPTASPTDSPVSPTDSPAASPIVSTPAAAYGAFRVALEQLLTQHIFPDGKDCGYTAGTGSFSDNEFAVYDVDGDGADELIISFVTAPMAGNVETVYHFDEASQMLVSELSAFPLLTYYSNGTVTAGWSHNQGLAGDTFWPYSLFVYDAKDRVYNRVADVDAWDKSITDTDSSGNTFPDDIDAEGNGIVFFVTEDGTQNTLSKTDYEKWFNAKLDGASELDIPYKALTEENIAEIG